MARVVRAFPLLEGKRDTLMSFLAELEKRAEDTAQFYKAYGVTRESAHVQSTPQGDLLIVCTDLADADATARAYAAEAAPFHAWFKGKVLEVTGFDPNQTPFGPEGSCVLDWPGQP